MDDPIMIMNETKQFPTNSIPKIKALVRRLENIEMALDI
jgi:hypothetical protein